MSSIDREREWAEQKAVENLFPVKPKANPNRKRKCDIDDLFATSDVTVPDTVILQSPLFEKFYKYRLMAMCLPTAPRPPKAGEVCVECNDFLTYVVTFFCALQRGIKKLDLKELKPEELKLFVIKDLEKVHNLINHLLQVLGPKERMDAIKAVFQFAHFLLFDLKVSRVSDDLHVYYSSLYSILLKLPLTKEHLATISLNEEDLDKINKYDGDILMKAWLSFKHLLPYMSSFDENDPDKKFSDTFPITVFGPHPKPREIITRLGLGQDGTDATKEAKRLIRKFHSYQREMTIRLGAFIFMAQVDAIRDRREDQ